MLLFCYHLSGAEQCGAQAQVAGGGEQEARRRDVQEGSSMRDGVGAGASSYSHSDRLTNPQEINSHALTYHNYQLFLQIAFFWCSLSETLFCHSKELFWIKSFVSGADTQQVMLTTESQSLKSTT